VKSYLPLCALAALLALTAGAIARAQDAKPDAPKPEKITIKIDASADPRLGPVAGDITRLFFKSYPELLKRWDNPAKPTYRDVTILFKKINVPAYASGDTVTCNVDWFLTHPDDIGAVTHELTHVVQHYPRYEPSWLVEGIADYSRYEYGPKEDTKWKLPAVLGPKNSYTNSYRVTAKFLVWLDQKYPGTVDKIHHHLQEGAFSVDDFKTFTGKSLDDLWKECVDSQTAK
jgi:hypothetical protein